MHECMHEILRHMGIGNYALTSLLCVCSGGACGCAHELQSRACARLQCFRRRLGPFEIHLHAHLVSLCLHPCPSHNAIFRFFPFIHSAFSCAQKRRFCLTCIALPNRSVEQKPEALVNVDKQGNWHVKGRHRGAQAQSESRKDSDKFPGSTATVSGTKGRLCVGVCSHEWM